MFYGASSFKGDISLWDTSNVTDTYGMFERVELPEEFCPNFHHNQDNDDDNSVVRGTQGYVGSSSVSFCHMVDIILQYRNFAGNDEQCGVDSGQTNIRAVFHTGIEI